MTPTEWLLADAVVAVGALLQGAVGFGVALVAAPVLALLDPGLIPGPMILAALVLTLLMAVRDRRGMDLRGLSWAIPGHLAGTAAAAVLVAAIPPRGLGVTFGILILLAVGLSAVGRAPPVRRDTLLGAGLLSGFMGTTTSVGGPPIALLLQGAEGPRLRGTLSGFFFLGGLVSLVGLAAAGRFGLPEAAQGLALVPGILAGFALSHRAARRVDRGWVRPAVLAVAAAAAMGVLIRSLG